jgi:MFS family permease
LPVSTTRRYTLAGLVAAGYQVGYSAAGPFSARLCDRRGQSEILPWAALATGISRVLLLPALWQDAAGGSSSCLRRSPAAPFQALMVTFVAVGATLYTMELATVAFCQAHGWKAASGWTLAASAAASAVAGIWYGARDWGATPERRLATALLPFAGGMALFLGVWSIPSLVVPRTWPVFRVE